MATPVINPTTSIPGAPQWQTWSYQPWATGLVAGTIVPRQTVANAAARLALTKNQIALNDYVLQSDANMMFKVTTTPPSDGSTTPDSSFTSLSWNAWNDVWTSPALPPGLSLNAATGAITGAVTVAGTYNIGLQVQNINGLSAPLNFVIGIEARAYSAHSGVDMFVNLRTNAATRTKPDSSTSSASTDGDVFEAKLYDDLLIYIQFFKDGTVLDLGTLAALEFALKELDGNPDIVVSDSFKKIGSGTDTVYILHVKFAGDNLDGTLSNYMADGGTAFEGLAAIRWQENSADDPRSTPSTLCRESNTFPIKVSRNIVES